MEENIDNHASVSVGELKDGFINIKDINIKRLQNENHRLQENPKKLESGVRKAKTDTNSLNKYAKRKNMFLKVLPNLLKMDDKSLLSLQSC